MPEFFACQFTGKIEEKWVPGKVVRGRRGDIVLVPGGNGIIGGLLAHVGHPEGKAQRYAHSGIMTKNFVEISHSTASKDWLRDHARGVDGQPTDGFEPLALRFQWPGGITQSAEAAYGGSEFTSPEGKPYRLGAFNLVEGAFIDGQWQLIPPLLLKPPPELEYSDPNVRKRVMQVADEVKKLCVDEEDTAAGRQSKTHYRFYCYTDAAVALRPSPNSGVVGPAPPEAGWANGTLPTVCSSIIWLAVHYAGKQLEGAGTFTEFGDLEPDPDLAAGAATDRATRDGLYLYSEEKRIPAAEWLVEYLIDEIYKTEEKELGWFGGALNEAASDMADDCAYQITNTFAFDWADGDAKNSDRWKQPGEGRAVSPDNLMLWDNPQKSRWGLWGYAEPLVYHSGRMDSVPEHKWRKTGGPGTIEGTVRFQGLPCPNAELNAGGTFAGTDHDGRFSMKVMEGRYRLKAEALISAEIGIASAAVDVTVDHDNVTSVIIDLQPPPERYRLIIVDAEIYFRDDEFTLNPFEDDPDEYASDRRHWVFHVNPWTTHSEEPYEKGWGGECRIEARIAVDLNPDLSVRVKLSGDLFEGATENTNERDGRNEKEFWVAAGAKEQSQTFRVSHEGEEDTYAEFQLKITNRAQL